MKTQEHRFWHVPLAIAALMALTAQNASTPIFSTLQVGMVQWTQASHVTVLTQWALPALTALSGAIFLTSSHAWNLQTLWQRVIPWAAMSCIFWWGATAVIYIQQHHPLELDLSTFMHCLSMVLSDPSNISFCQMQVSMFLLYPLLRLIAQNRQVTRYCLMALFVVNLLFPMIRLLPAGATVSLFTDQLNWGYFRSWAFYLLLGVYLTEQPLCWQTQLGIVCAGIVATGLMAALTSWQTVAPTGFCQDYLGLHSPFTALQTAAVFLCFTHLSKCKRRPQLTHTLRGLWMCPPAAAVIQAMSSRFLPAYEGQLIPFVLMHVAVDTLMTLALIAGLGALPGFRRLVGDYHTGGETR